MKKTNNHHLFAITGDFPNVTWEPIGSHSYPITGQIWRSCPIWEPLSEDLKSGEMYSCEISIHKAKDPFRFRPFDDKFSLAKQILCHFLSPSTKYIRLVDLFPQLMEQFSRGIAPERPLGKLDDDCDVFVPIVDGYVIGPNKPFVALSCYISEIDYSKYHGGTRIQQVTPLGS